MLAIFFAAYLLVDGISNVIGSVQNRQKDGWWIMLLIGVLGVLKVFFAFKVKNLPERVESRLSAPGHVR